MDVKNYPAQNVGANYLKKQKKKKQRFEPQAKPTEVEQELASFSTKIGESWAVPQRLGSIG